MTLMQVHAMNESTDEVRWLAVCDRDPNADGHFVYGVITTGIYCHPSCGSRAPRRENVRFFDTAADARASGLRPCKRCRPDEAPPAERDRQLIELACRRLADEASPTVAAVAAELGVGRHWLQRRFVALTGVTPKAWQLSARRAALADTLERSQRVTDAAFQGGYRSTTRLYQDSAQRLGMTPQSLRRGAPGEVIRHALVDTAMGRTLIGWTDVGVCAIAFGETDAQLQEDLRRRFPKAEHRTDTGEGRDLVQRVIACIELPQAADALPLDIRGTLFQELTWQALQRIPVGTTASYAQVASSIGRPAAHRAVAAACAANPLAVVVPCHRVVRADGGLSGYRWGIARKRALLQREGGIAEHVTAIDCPVDS